MKVVAVLPCRGRVFQTLELIPRLKHAAGMGFSLVCVADGDAACAQALEQVRGHGVDEIVVQPERRGYWASLQRGAAERPDDELIVNLANDLLPGRNWLRRAYDAHVATFAETGLVGFNDGIHEGRHAAHFLISRALLERWYGAALWPQMYQHEFGDAEISARAMEEHRFAVAHWAVLYHNHPYTGGNDDATYAEGRGSRDDDYNLFVRRKAAGWKAAGWKGG